MRNNTKKLTLVRETIRSLQPGQLRHIAGGVAHPGAASQDCTGTIAKANVTGVTNAIVSGGGVTNELTTMTQ